MDQRIVISNKHCFKYVYRVAIHNMNVCITSSFPIFQHLETGKSQYLLSIFWYVLFILLAIHALIVVLLRKQNKLYLRISQVENMIYFYIIYLMILSGVRPAIIPNQAISSLIFFFSSLNLLIKMFYSSMKDDWNNLKSSKI